MTAADKSYTWATGRRKTAVARVRLRPGKGDIIVNKRSLKEYFPTLHSQAMVESPLKFTKTFGMYDIYVNVRGGGVTSQAGAVLLGISRGLVRINKDLDKLLRDEGYLTRDARAAERKKPGRPGARRSFQFSKR